MATTIVGEKLWLLQAQCMFEAMSFTMHQCKNNKSDTNKLDKLRPSESSSSLILQTNVEPLGAMSIGAYLQSFKMMGDNHFSI